MQPQQIDKDWFVQALAAKNKSLRGLARHLDIDPSAASRMLSGERRMKTEEATAIAQFLNLPIKEVLKHAGASVDLDGRPTTVMLAAVIDGKGDVVRMPDPRPLPQSVVDKAQAAISAYSGSRILAAQVRALNGPLSIFDDAVLLFRSTDTVEASAVGALSICRDYEGRQMLARVERARKTGEARIVRFDGGIEEADLQTASPVLAIIP